MGKEHLVFGRLRRRLDGLLSAGGMENSKKTKEDEFMAVKGLTPQLAERGKVKIGEKGEMKTSQGGRQFAQPRKLDHFLITTMQRDAAGRLLPDAGLTARLKPESGKITEIPVRLLYDDIDLNFPTRFACYRGNRCWCSGDGEWAKRIGEGRVDDPTVSPGYRQAQATEYGRVPCPCERQDPFYQGQDRCKILGTLQVLIEGTDRIGGVWKFRTTSWNTVNAILSSLALIKTITGGPLAGIPLHLVLSPKTVTVPATGQNMVVYVVSLEYRGPESKLAELGYDIARKRMEHRVKMEQIEAEARRLLLPPQAESPDEQEEVAQEFYPEAAASEPEAEEKVEVIPPANETEAPAVQAQQSGNGNRSITLPALMELVKKPNAEFDLPVPLVTTKGVSIGRWLDWGPNAAGEMQITLELVDNLKEVAQGLTVEDVKKAFGNANLILVVTTAPAGSGVQVTEPPAQDGGLQGEVNPEAQNTASQGKRHLKPVANPAQESKTLF